MDDAVLGRSETDKTATPPARPLRRLFVGLIFLISFLAACSLLAIEATEPFSRPESCTNCHEMQGVYDRWAKSSHHDNPSGVKATCIACHLPPREDHFAHLAAKTHKGASHAWTHFFGRFDEQSSRKLVLDTLPNQRCTHCHDNLIAMPSKPAVGAVHTTAIKLTSTRTYACVSCHSLLHSKKPPAPEKKFYDDADNSYCYVCHINFKKEPFVLQHKAANIGCVTCHGQSEPHADDEEHSTAPDIMYTKNVVNASCSKKGCHAPAKMEKVTSHKPWYAGAEPDKKYCTDCHNQHRLETRQRKWDKKTKKLISRDGYDLDPNEVIEEEEGERM